MNCKRELLADNHLRAQCLVSRSFLNATAINYNYCWCWSCMSGLSGSNNFMIVISVAHRNAFLLSNLLVREVRNTHSKINERLTYPWLWRLLENGISMTSTSAKVMFYFKFIGCHSFALATPCAVAGTISEPVISVFQTQLKWFHHICHVSTSLLRGSNIVYGFRTAEPVEGELLSHCEQIDEDDLFLTPLALRVGSLQEDIRDNVGGRECQMGNEKRDESLLMCESR